jgi:hypothetical protein
MVCFIELFVNMEDSLVKMNNQSRGGVLMGTKIDVEHRPRGALCSVAGSQANAGTT